MELHFKIMVAIQGSRSLHFGRCKADDLSFSIDPNGEAAKYGCLIYQRIKRDTGYRDIQLLTVTYNEENDITELVKQTERKYLGKNSG